MKGKKKSKKSIPTDNTESENEGIIGMLISMHTFPLESEEELLQKQKLIEELKNGVDQNAEEL
jgi:hypothetical protein